MALRRTGRRDDAQRERGTRTALRLFHRAAERVPAYKDFLKKSRVNPERVRTIADFQLVPPVSKANYLRTYPLEKLVWDGSLARSAVFSATSGSTGEPFYFPRNKVLEEQSACYHELFLRRTALKSEPRLVVICFGMGVWVGGLITHRAFQILANRGYRLAIVSPGVNKREALDAIKNLSVKFKQTILCGYPPLVKDIIDQGTAEGIVWKKLHLRIIFAAESFSEDFRDYVVSLAGIRSACRDTMNIYGTADLGTMAEETPLSILVRRRALDRAELYRNIFGNTSRLPTLAQFNPDFIHFEEIDGRLLITGDSVLPLIRYDLGDRGGVRGFADVQTALAEEHITVRRELQRTGGGEFEKWPFVFVYERDDLSTKFYGAIVYPEPVREALQAVHLRRFVTGKFTMVTQTDRNHDQYLEVHVELRGGVTPPARFVELCRAAILNRLIARSTEYHNNYKAMPQKVTPRVVLWEYEHPLHFKPGIKQRWVKKANL